MARWAVWASPSETVYQTRCAPAWDPVAKLWKILIINSGDYSGTAYAQSTDGLHWTKPNLGQVEVNGSRENTSRAGSTPVCKTPLFTRRMEDFMFIIAIPFLRSGIRSAVFSRADVGYS